MGLFLKIVIIAVGALLLLVSAISLAKRWMNESFCLIWGVISVVMIVAGILINPSGILSYISAAGLIIILLIMAMALYVALCVTHIISDLMRKNNDLAIEVSLLKKENEDIANELKEMRNRQ